MVRVALIGCGKFATMFLAQARRLATLEITAAVDIDLDKARAAFARAGWTSTARGPLHDHARRRRRGVDIVVEATGLPRVGTRHALQAIDAGKHVVLVNVEADVLVGPALARRAAARGVHCSMAYGDQPALICELVDWARTCGFEVVCAGKGTKYLPLYHSVDPDGVWEHYGFTPEEVATGDYNAKMFTSFLDGTKSAIEMAAVANATGLLAARARSRVPARGGRRARRRLPPGRARGRARAHADGRGRLVSATRREPGGARPALGRVRDVHRARRLHPPLLSPSTARRSTRPAPTPSLYRPNHFIGLELAVSVLSLALRGEPTGETRAFSADVVAVAKRDLRAGERLDGEGGYCVWGRCEPAATSVRERRIPIGLADQVSSPARRGGGSTHLGRRAPAAARRGVRATRGDAAVSAEPARQPRAAR